MRRPHLTLAAAAVAATVTMAQTPGPVLAPTGTLRAAFLGGNPVHARVDPASGTATGPVPDLIREMARRAQVPSMLLPEANVAGVVAALRDGRADIGFLAFDEARAREVDFGAPFLVMLSSYLVATASPIRSDADIDRPQVVVGAVRGTTQQIFVSRALARAQIRMFETMPPQGEVERLLASGELSAFAINRQRSLDAAHAAPARLRVLPGSFVSVNQAVAVPRGERARLDAASAIVNELVRSGFVKASVERAGIDGVEVPRKE